MIKHSEVKGYTPKQYMRYMHESFREVLGQNPHVISFARENSIFPINQKVDILESRRVHIFAPSTEKDNLWGDWGDFLSSKDKQIEFGLNSDNAIAVVTWRIGGYFDIGSKKEDYEKLQKKISTDGVEAISATLVHFIQAYLELYELSQDSEKDDDYNLTIRYCGCFESGKKDGHEKDGHVILYSLENILDIHSDDDQKRLDSVSVEEAAKNCRTYLIEKILVK